MEDVAAVARLIADHDPDINPFGPSVALPAGLPRQQAAALVGIANCISVALGNLHLRTVLETGLIVTYARPFTEGRGFGFPIPAEDFVPSERRELHQKMLDLRHKVQAHIDASAPERYLRTVTRAERPGSSSVTSSGPRYLSAAELRELADLADVVAARLQIERSA